MKYPIIALIVKWSILLMLFFSTGCKVEEAPHTYQWAVTIQKVGTIDPWYCCDSYEIQGDDLVLFVDGKMSATIFNVKYKDVVITRIQER